jgi:hypothetical protein
MIDNSFECENTPEEIAALLVDAETRSNNNSRIGSDEIMTSLQSLETRVLSFKKQGGDVFVSRRVVERLEALSLVLRRVCERLDALLSQMVTKDEPQN